MLRCFPDKTEAERYILEKQFYHWFCDMLMEVIYSYRISDEEIRERITFSGIEEMEQTFAHYGGGFIMLPHFGCWEWFADLGKRFTSPNTHFHVIYRRLKNEQSDKLMHVLRTKRGCDLIDKNLLLRKMVTNRKEPGVHVYAMLSDQKPSKNNLDCWLPFFGEETPFINGTEILAQKFGYPVFNTHITMPSRGHYTMEFISADFIPGEKNSGEKSITEQFAQKVEDDIRQTPHIWLWTHNRFKWTKADQEQHLKNKKQQAK